MKKIILLLSLFFNVFIYAQEKKAENQNSELVSEKAEKITEFPGGMDAFRNLIMKNFRTDKLKIERGIIKTTVIFKITKDGSMTDIKALGGNQIFNDEAIRAVTKIKEKWTRAKLNNEIVESIFRMPLTMSFE